MMVEVSELSAGESTMAALQLCPQCGSPLATDLAQATCPACLLRAGLENGCRDGAPRALAARAGDDRIPAGSGWPGSGGTR